MRLVAPILVALSAAPALGGPLAPVVGGENAPDGKWPDAAAILFDDGGTDVQKCTGTLVAANVVLTAAHCDDSTLGVLDNVLVGASSLAHPSEGEIIKVRDALPFPDWEDTSDIAALVLDHPASETPRALATGWAYFDIQNGASVELVGFGAIDINGTMFTPQLQQAETTITDFDCESLDDGCKPDAQPDGELEAGGNGIDTCDGDSGGPLYLNDDFGTFLAGVTSRGLAQSVQPCGDGGIYARPDKIADWIEQATGSKVARGPAPSAPDLVASRGDAGETSIYPNDPRSMQHTFEITQQPAQGMAAVRADGRVRVCVDADADASDAMSVRVTDSNVPSRSLDLTIKIDVYDGTPAASCNVNAFSGASSGCLDAGHGPRGVVPIAIAAWIVARRRRRLR
ncbi:MAG TPA: serine protease [Kofleriaceae bacterium]|nr:serine protease [Kofleriaceae bacterium]